MKSQLQTFLLLSFRIYYTDSEGSDNKQICLLFGDQSNW